MVAGDFIVFWGEKKMTNKGIVLATALAIAIFGDNVQSFCADNNNNNDAELVELTGASAVRIQNVRAEQLPLTLSRGCAEIFADNRRNIGITGIVRDYANFGKLTYRFWKHNRSSQNTDALINDLRNVTCYFLIRGNYDIFTISLNPELANLIRLEGYEHLVSGLAKLQNAKDLMKTLCYNVGINLGYGVASSGERIEQITEITRALKHSDRDLNNDDHNQEGAAIEEEEEDREELEVTEEETDLEEDELNREIPNHEIEMQRDVLVAMPNNGIAERTTEGTEIVAILPHENTVENIRQEIFEEEEDWGML